MATDERKNLYKQTFNEACSTPAEELKNYDDLKKIFDLVEKNPSLRPIIDQMWSFLDEELFEEYENFFIENQKINPTFREFVFHSNSLACELRKKGHLKHLQKFLEINSE